jgi:hypothetical protein
MAGTALFPATFFIHAIMAAANSFALATLCDLCAFAVQSVFC